MADIYTPWSMNGLEMPNRLVRSATWEGLADDKGAPTHELILALAALAEGGCGLIITGYCYVSPEGKGLPKQTGVYMDALVGPLTRITDAVHTAGGKIAMQIVHAGGQTKQEWTGFQPVGPSAMTHPAFGEEVAELSVEDIHRIIDDFALGAARAKAAGFDAVQLHGAHGYLLSQFNSPFTNKRQDEYGGDWEGRGRMMFEVLQAARNAVGPNYPLFIKLNSVDGLEGGLELEDAVKMAKRLGDMGIDAIEVSGGQPAAGKLGAARVVKDAEDEGYFLDNAKAIKEVADCPVITVGGYRSKDVVASALDEVEAVAMCRPFIRQPDLVNLWKTGDAKATCISCGGCLAVGLEQGLGCSQELKKQKKGGA